MEEILKIQSIIKPVLVKMTQKILEEKPNDIVKYHF